MSFEETVESVSFYYRRGIKERVDQGGDVDVAVERLIDANTKLIQARTAKI